MLRRLYIVGLLALLLGAKLAQGLAAPRQAPSGMATVALVPIAGDVEAAVRQAVALAGGFDELIDSGDTVVVKPNLVIDVPVERGVGTDPAVVRAVVRLAREAGAATVVIAEGTALYYGGNANRDRYCTLSAFQNAGYDSDGDMIDDDTGAPLIDLNDSGGTDVADPALVTRVVVPDGLMRTEYWLPNVVLEADVLISVPVLKNHSLAGVTLGIKNLFGTLPNDLYHGPGNIYGKHSLSHSPIELEKHITDVSLARGADFVVVDGQRGMTDGPTGWAIINPPMNLILAGRDVVAADTVGTLLMGYKPDSIAYLGFAAQAGLGVADTAYIQVVGTPLTQLRRDFPDPYGESPARRAEAQAPTVAFTAPVEDEWQGEVKVIVSASDNDAIARVELYLDGKLRRISRTSPYQFTLNTIHYSPGAHTVRAVAYDRSLNQSQTSRTVNLIWPAIMPHAYLPLVLKKR